MDSLTEIRCGKIFWRPKESIVQFDVKTGAYMEYDDAVDVRKLIIATAKIHDKPVYFYVDMRGIKGASKEGRNYFSSHPNPVVKACAILVGSGFSRLLGNFLIGLNKPKYPIRLFTKETDAIAFLQKHQEANGH